jgi:hypothetical protein
LNATVENIGQAANSTKICWSAAFEVTGWFGLLEYRLHAYKNDMVACYLYDLLSESYSQFLMAFHVLIISLAEHLDLTMQIAVNESQ